MSNKINPGRRKIRTSVYLSISNCYFWLRCEQLDNVTLLITTSIFTGKKKWTKTYYNWLAKLKMKYPAQKVAFQEYIDAIHECSQRVSRLTEQIHQTAEEWRMGHPAVSPPRNYLRKVMDTLSS